MVITNLRVLIIANLRGVDWMTHGINNYSKSQGFSDYWLRGSVIIPSLKGSMIIGSSVQ